ncbi:MAG: hypothetical protein GX207_00945 [Peptococcaceae bacterium]|nr:hypothetical protein [Peptococcaceae bacterium]
MRLKGLVRRFVSLFVVLSMLATSVPVYAGEEGETEALSLLSKEHQATFASLLNQINSQGIGVWAAGVEEALSPSGIDYRTRVALEIPEPVMVSYESDQTAVLKFSLLYPHSQEVSFDYVIYPGSMGAEYYNVTPAEGTVTFGTGETEKELEITIPKLENNPVEYGIASDFGDFWIGDKVFYIYCSNIRNALFVNNKDTMTLPVPIENQFDLQETYSKARSTPLIDLNNPAHISDGISFPETPGKYQPEKGEDGSARIRLKGAPLEGDLRIMIDLGVFSHLSLPVGYMSYSPGEEEPATGEVSFKVEKYLIFPSDPSVPIGPVSAGYEKSIPVEGNQETGFNLEESGQVEIGQVGLGSYLEANGLAKSLDFVFAYPMLPGEVFTYFHDQEGNYIPEQIYFSDQVSPRVVEVNLAADPVYGNSIFYLGDIVPITVRYSEPVQSDDIVITANGQQLTPVEREGTISATMSFLYEIAGDEESEKAIRVTALTGAVDLAGNP